MEKLPLCGQNLRGIKFEIVTWEPCTYVASSIYAINPAKASFLLLRFSFSDSIGLVIKVLLCHALTNYEIIG